MPFFSKLLFPKASPGGRRRKMRALRWGALAAVLIVAIVVGLLYLIYQRVPH